MSTFLQPLSCESHSTANNDVTKEAKLSFNEQQSECLCMAMRQKKEFEKLQVFLEECIGPDGWRFENNEEVLVARANVAFFNRNYDQVFSIIKSRDFHPSRHNDMQHLWYQAHYDEAQAIRGRSLRAVEKYRLRKKAPLPTTIWDGEYTVYCFKETSRRVLKSNFFKNQYPCHEEKLKLSQQTGLTVLQVSD